MVLDFMEKNQTLNPDIYSKMLSGSSINSYDCYIFSVSPRSLFPTLLAIERTSTLQHKQ